MLNFKIFIVSIITVSYVVQFGSVILEKTRYSKIYKFISGVVILFSLFNLPINNSLNYIPVNQDAEIFSKDIKSEFENNLKNQILDDLHNKYYVNQEISVSTDFDSIKIYIYNNDDEANSIKEYLTEKYCTPNDEVIIVDEEYIDQ